MAKHLTGYRPGIFETTQARSAWVSAMCTGDGLSHRGEEMASPA